MTAPHCIRRRMSTMIAIAIITEMTALSTGDPSAAPDLCDNWYPSNVNHRPTDWDDSSAYQITGSHTTIPIFWAPLFSKKVPNLSYEGGTKAARVCAILATGCDNSSASNRLSACPCSPVPSPRPTGCSGSRRQQTSRSCSQTYAICAAVNSGNIGSDRHCMDASVALGKSAIE